MIEVLAMPPVATVQDLGREGYWSQGLGRAGAMDRRSLAMANLLLGNAPGAPALEIPLTPARLRFRKRMAFALAGAACSARLSGLPLPAVWAGVAEEDALLELGGMTNGALVYLALPGGIDVPMMLGSHSTQLREAFGGYGGRVLAPGDILREARSDAPALPAAGLSLAMPPLRAKGETAIQVRALPSAEEPGFTEASRNEFWSSEWLVTRDVNRMGYRLEGPTLERATSGELRSHGIVPGIVQVPGGGQPIIQLADSATMGGYPKIAAVIEADLWRVAQARPGDRLRFVRVDLTQAAAAEIEAGIEIDTLRTALNQAFELQAKWGDHAVAHRT
ncbi:MAG: biotin-dependent carboxyltransferase family protein [Gemmobacter sp.]|jgi:biotin-dependent carboxylase-like uncharacterized protein